MANHSPVADGFLFLVATKSPRLVAGTIFLLHLSVLNQIVSSKHGKAKN
jgi:hypothetical protein